ncbi:MAG: ABC transporter permease [Oscillospiraceae bacterium]|nr:ABC transporter permease [Oscillospiraceae bacterium]
MAQTHGAAFKMEPATAQDLPHFMDMEGLTAEYEGGAIYVHIASENRISEEEELAYMSLLMTRAAQSGNAALSVFNLLHMGEDSSITMFSNQLLWVNAVIICLSLIIIQSAYKVHLNKFESDMGILVSYGAQNSQLIRMFLLEFLAVFLLSSLCAVLISAATLFALFKLFLEIKDTGNLAWIIFHINPASIFITLAMFLAAGLALVYGLLRKKLSQTTANLMKSAAGGGRIKPGAKAIKLLKSPARSLARLFQKRNQAPFNGSLLVVMPITIVAIFIFNYLMINIASISAAPKHEVVLRYEAINGENVGFTPDDIDYIHSLPDVQNVHLDYNLSSTKYLIEDERAEGASSLISGDRPYAMTKIMQYSSMNDAEEPLSGKYDVAVSKNHAFLKYNVGDTILLYPYEDGAGSNIELMVTKLLDLEWTDRMVALYLSDDLYADFTQGEPIATVQIQLKEASQSPAVATLLAERFVGAEYSIIDAYSMHEKNQQTTTGYYMLALIVFGILFAFVLVIIYTKLTDYITMQKSMNRNLHILGAESSDLYKAYMRQTIHAALFAILLSFGIGFGLILLFFKGTGYHVSLTPLTITVQAAIALFIFLTFFASVGSAVKRQLKAL